MIVRLLYAAISGSCVTMTTVMPCSRFRRVRSSIISWLRFVSIFVFPRIKDTVPMARESHKLAYHILETTQLATVPGAAFGPAGECHLRLSFGREMPELEDGLNRLAAYFDKTKPAGQRPALNIPAQPPSVTHTLKDRIKQSVKYAATTYVRRNHPLIIGIAGTTGKTVFKRTLLDALQAHFPCRASILSWNTAIGLALSILDLEAPRSSSQGPAFALRVLTQAFSRTTAREVLILEYGVLHPGDAAALKKIASPDYLILSAACNAGPGTDYKQVQAGLLELAADVQPAHIFWNDEDPILKEISGGWAPSGRLGLEGLPPDSQLVGNSAKLALLASTRLLPLLDAAMKSEG